MRTGDLWAPKGRDRAAAAAAECGAVAARGVRTLLRSLTRRLDRRGGCAQQASSSTIRAVPHETDRTQAQAPRSDALRLPDELLHGRPAPRALARARRRPVVARDADGPLHRAAWVSDTGELYLVRLGPPEQGGGQVEVLATVAEHEQPRARARWLARALRRAALADMAARARDTAWRAGARDARRCHRSDRRRERACSPPGVAGAGELA